MQIGGRLGPQIPRQQLEVFVANVLSKVVREGCRHLWFGLLECPCISIGFIGLFLKTRTLKPNPRP